MNQSPNPKPTPAELAILKELWRRPGSSVRELHEAKAEKDTGYTTLLKTVQIMLDKGLVTREQDGRAHRYFAAVEEEPTKRHIVRELADRLFDGASASLVMCALSQDRPSRDELAEIRRLIDALDDEDRS